MSPLDSVRQEIASARDRVARMRAAIAAGEDFDTDRFNTEIAAACKNVVSLPFNHAAEIKDDLAALLEQLTLIKSEIEAAEQAEPGSIPAPDDPGPGGQGPG